MEVADLKPGDKVWFVPNASYMGNARELTVEKVGRRWTYFVGERYRVDRVTGRFDTSGNWAGVGSIYKSKAEHTAARELASTWVRFKDSWRHAHIVPPGVTIDDIKSAAKLLGIDLEKSQ